MESDSPCGNELESSKVRFVNNNIIFTVTIDLDNR